MRPAPFLQPNRGTASSVMDPAVMILAVLLAALLWLAPRPSIAGGLNLELSQVEDGPQGCLATLSIGNDLGQTLDRFRLDLILFDGNDMPFDRLLIDLAPLPAGRATMARFPLHAGRCASISRIVLRAVPACRAQTRTDDGGAHDCLSGLTMTTRTAIGLGR